METTNLAKIIFIFMVITILGSSFSSCSKNKVNTTKQGTLDYAQTAPYSIKEKLCFELMFNNEISHELIFNKELYDRQVVPRGFSYFDSSLENTCYRVVNNEVQIRGNYHDFY